MKSYKILSMTISTIIFYLVIAAFTSYAYDESFYYQYYRWVYLYSVQPYFLWVFGAFYNSLNVGFLSINLPFYLLGIDNVIIQQFSVKLPLIISSIITGYSLTKILNIIKPSSDKNYSTLSLFLLLPITIFDVALFGNPLIVSVMFLVLSILFVAKSKTRISAILLGMSAATYLFPIFFILPYVKFVGNKYSTKEKVYSFILFVVTLAIGQGLPLFISLLTSTPLSDTILASLVQSQSSITVTSAIPSMWGPYFIILHILGYNVPSLIKEIIFLSAMGIPMLIFIFKRDPLEIKDYINFLFIEGIIFIIFSITETPQYLIVIAPFVVLLYYLKRTPFYIFLFSFITSLDILIFYIQTPLFYFYSNINPAYGYIYKIDSIPKWTEILITGIYLSSLFILYLYHIRIERVYSQNNSKKIQKFFHINSEKVYSFNNIIKRGFALLVIVLIVTLVVSVPFLDHVPNEMYFTNGASSQSIDAKLYHTSKNTDMYYLNFSTSYNLLNSYTRVNGEYILKIPMSNTIDYQYKNNLMNSTFVSNFSNHNFSVSIVPTINPVSVNQTVIFYPMIHGGEPPFTYCWSNGRGFQARNETSIFNNSGNFSVELIVKDANGQKAIANYNEMVLSNYTVYLNSFKIGSYPSSHSQQLVIMPSIIKMDNYLNITGNFSSNQTINLYFYMPSHVPSYVIFDNSLYLSVGLFSGIISLVSLTYIIRKIKT